MLGLEKTRNQVEIFNIGSEDQTTVNGKRIAILGLAFKPNTDNRREAVSIPIINQLLKEGADVTAYDPVAVSNAKSIFGDKIKYASSAIECLKNTDCCIIVTEWQEFKRLKPEDHTKHANPHPNRRKKNLQPEEFSNKLKFAAMGRGQ